MKFRMGWYWNVGLGNCTEEWRLGLKMLNRSLRPANIVAYRPMIEAKAYELLSQVLANPDSDALEAHLNQFVDSSGAPPVFLTIVPTVQPGRIGSIIHGVWL
jgi:hypothetical protein